MTAPEPSPAADEPALASRAGLKLRHALRTFALPVTDLVCADFGCNAGGFTDVLLRAGAAEVFAVGTAPASMPDPRSAKPAQIIAATKSSCTEAGLKAYLGLADDFPTRFQFKAHFPSAEQWAAGQRWVRCDVVLRDQLALGTWAGTAAAAVQAQGATAFRFCTPSVGLLEAPARILA